MLVVEVSDSSLWFDLNVKAKIYARVGIAEYWVMDVAMGVRFCGIVNPSRKRLRRNCHIFGEDELIAAPGRSETARVGELFAPAVRKQRINLQESSLNYENRSADFCRH